MSEYSIPLEELSAWNIACLLARGEDAELRDQLATRGKQADDIAEMLRAISQLAAILNTRDQLFWDETDLIHLVHFARKRGGSAVELADIERVIRRHSEVLR